MAIFSSLLLFGVDCMIRSQFKASRLVAKKDTSLINDNNSSASEPSLYKNTESQPMLEDECSSTHFNQKISDFLMGSDRETDL